MIRFALPLALSAAAVLPAFAQSRMVVVLKDGRRQSFAVSDVARIEFTQESAPPPAAEPDALPGTYAWVSGQTLILHPNRTLDVYQGNSKINDGRWEVLDAGARKYRFVHRLGGWIDTVTLSADGHTLTGVNNRGYSLKGTRK